MCVCRCGFLSIDIFLSVCASLHVVPCVNTRKSKYQHENAYCKFIPSSMTRAKIPVTRTRKRRYSHNAVWEKLMKASPACEISEGGGDEGGPVEIVSCETAGARGGGCGGSAAKGRGGASGSGRKGGTQQGWGRAFGMFLCDNVLRSRTPSQDERKRRSMSGENPDSSGHTPSSGGFERFRTSNFVLVHFKSCDTHVRARSKKHTHRQKTAVILRWHFRLHAQRRYIFSQAARHPSQQGRERRRN